MTLQNESEKPPQAATKAAAAVMLMVKADQPAHPSYCEGTQKSGLKIFANLSLPGRRDASETLENRSEA